MISPALVERSIQDGGRRAEAMIRASRSRRLAAAAKPFAGYLIMEGDSWFDYPLYHDVAEALKDDFNYKIKSAAHFGDTVASMAYDHGQLGAIRDQFSELAEDGKTARAILVSCAGNDVVDVLGALLNHRQSNLGPVNASVAKGVFDEQLPQAIGSLVGTLMQLSTTYFNEVRPILIHGYGNPIPDGRGYPILGLRGPWLKPVFGRRGYVSVEPQPQPELKANADVMAELMGLFNDEVLPAIAAASGGNVTYVDVRPALVSDVAGRSYEASWEDELHATKAGFKAVARLIHAAIQVAAPAVP